MKQVYLVLDWSNLAFRSLFMNSFGATSAPTYHTDEEINAFIAKLATDVSYIIRIFNPTKVIFAADSKHSWRKDVLETYKSNRERDKRYDWEKIFKGLDDFKKHLSSKGFLFLETERAEADDLMAFMKEIVFEETEFANTNLILVSADADIRQLIDWKEYSNQYCMVFNEIGKGPGGKRHLYVNEDIMNWYSSTDAVHNDIFNFGIDSDKAYIKNILEINKKIEIETTDPKNILLSKIFCGDDGDAVPAFYDWYNNKGKKVRVTNSKFVKILESLNAHDISIIDAKKKQLKPVLENVCFKGKKTINDIDVEERLERQEKLVQLSSDKFPEKIRAYKPIIKKMLLEHTNNNCFNITMKDLIQGSVFETVLKKQQAKDADIFKNINKYVDSLNLEELF